MSDDTQCRPACPIDWMFGPLTDAVRARMKAEIANERDTCRNGHPVNAENTYQHPDGWRVCRPCRRAKDRRRKARAA